MRSKTIQQTTLFLCLLLSTYLNGQITIDYPENIRVECGADIVPSPDNPVVGYPDISTTCSSGISDVTFSDNIDELTRCGGTGTLLRFWSVSDNCGGFKTLLQRIVLVDNTPPEITCMPDVVVECDASLNPAENPDLGFPEVVDCSEGADLTINYEDVNEGDGFCENLPEIVRRTWTVTDACGNMSTCEQTIRIGKDPLLIFCDIEDIIHECNGLDGSRFAAESWDLSNTNQLRNCTQTDCGPVEIVSDFDYGRISGPCGITGSFEVNYLIKDNCGNSKFKIVNFILRDTTPPESFCNPIDFGVDCGGDETAASRVESWHTDNIDLLETCLFDNCGDVTVTSDFIATGFDINTLNFDCNDDEGFAVNYTLTDQCGNQTVKTAFLKVVDTTPPSFENVPRDTSIGASDNLAIGQPTIVDNCSNNLSAEFSEERIDNNNDNGYQLIRTWTTTDDCGNMNSASQRVMVLDPILSLACSSAEVKTEGDQIVISNLLAPNEIVKVFASDNRIVYNCFRNCGEVQTTRPLSDDTYKVTIEFYTANWRLICEDEKSIIIGNGSNNDGEGDNNDGGDNSGDNGNDEEEDPCTGPVCETVPPVLANLPADMTVNFDAVPAVTSPTATDNCDNDVQVAFLEERTDGENQNNYVLTRSWIATDDCGNTAMAEQVIRVTNEGNNGGNSNGNDGNTDPCTASDCETIAPIFGNIPADITVNYDAVPAPAQPVAADNCDTDVVVNLAETISQSTDARNYTLTRTWTATDDCGNKTTRQQIIRVTGETNMGDNGTDGDDNGTDGDDNGTDGGDNGTDEGNDTSGSNTDASDCSEVVISTGPLTFNFSNLNAPNKIVKVFDLDYNVVLECQDNCGTEISFSYETLGTYLADVQLYTADWEFICETRETVELTDVPVDTGDGGNDNGNMGDTNNACNDVQISVGSDAINITNIPTANKLIKLFDVNYNVVAECADDCGDPNAFSLPAIGEYVVDVQLYDANWAFICEMQTPISVNTTNDGNNNGNNNNSSNDDNSENTSDNPCENLNITHSSSAITLSDFSTTNKIVNIFDADYNRVYSCFTDCSSEVVAPIESEGAYLIDIQLYTDEWSLVCQQRTTIEVTANSDSSNPTTPPIGSGNMNNNGACAEATIRATNNTISVDNIDAQNAIVKVFSENFDIVYECVGNCGTKAVVTDLIDGDYQINLNYFDENWGALCERIENISLGNSISTSESPIPNTPSSSARTTNLPISTNNDIQVYPNPATNLLMIDLSKYGEEKVTIRLFNQLAATVWQGQFDLANHEVKQIDLQDMDAGLYIMYVQVGNRTPIAKKVVVKQ